jgi:hypothetical protein
MNQEVLADSLNSVDTANRQEYQMLGVNSEQHSQQKNKNLCLLMNHALYVLAMSHCGYVITNYVRTTVSKRALKRLPPTRAVSGNLSILVQLVNVSRMGQCDDRSQNVYLSSLMPTPACDIQE